MLLLPRTRASRAQPKAPPREARAMAICPHTTRGAEGVKVGEVARRVMAGSKGGAGRAPEDRFGVQRWVESPKVCGWECARLVCACMCSISVSECVGLVVRKTALLFPLPVLPPLSGSSELRLCCPAPAFKYLTPSLCFPLSSHPPSLPLSVSRSLQHQLHACCMRSTRRPPSSLSSSSSLLPLLRQSITLNFSLISFSPSLISSSLPLTKPFCYSILHSCIPLWRPWRPYLYASVSFFIPKQPSDRSLSLFSSFVFLPIHQTVSSSRTHYHTSFLPPY